MNPLAPLGPALELAGSMAWSILLVLAGLLVARSVRTGGVEMMRPSWVGTRSDGD